MVIETIQKAPWNEDSQLGKFLSKKGVEELVINILKAGIEELEEMKVKHADNVLKSENEELLFQAIGFNKALQEIINKKKLSIKELE